MNQTSKEMYQNIIYVMNYLCKLPKKQTKNINISEIHCVVSYVFNEYIKLKGINDKKEITEDMINELRKQPIYDNEIYEEIPKLSKDDIILIKEYICETDKSDHTNFDGFDAFMKLDKMQSKCII
jgi:hypothetical protein